MWVIEELDTIAVQVFRYVNWCFLFWCIQVPAPLFDGNQLAVKHNAIFAMGRQKWLLSFDLSQNAIYDSYYSRTTAFNWSRREKA